MASNAAAPPPIKDDYLAKLAKRKTLKEKNIKYWEDDALSGFKVDRSDYVFCLIENYTNMARYRSQTSSGLVLEEAHDLAQSSEIRLAHDFCRCFSEGARWTYAHKVHGRDSSGGPRRYLWDRCESQSGCRRRCRGTF